MNIYDTWLQAIKRIINLLSIVTKSEVKENKSVFSFCEQYSHLIRIVVPALPGVPQPWGLGGERKQELDITKQRKAAAESQNDFR